MKPVPAKSVVAAAVVDTVVAAAVAVAVAAVGTVAAAAGAVAAEDTGAAAVAATADAIATKTLFSQICSSSEGSRTTGGLRVSYHHSTRNNTFPIGPLFNCSNASKI